MGALLILLLLHQTLPALWVAPGLTSCSMQDLSHVHLSGHGSGQAKPKPGQSQRIWLGLRIPEAKATQSQAKASGFQAKPSQNITNCVGSPGTHSIVGSKPSDFLSAKAKAANSLTSASGCYVYF